MTFVEWHVLIGKKQTFDLFIFTKLRFIYLILLLQLSVENIDV